VSPCGSHPWGCRTRRVRRYCQILSLALQSAKRRWKPARHWKQANTPFAITFETACPPEARYPGILTRRHRGVRTLRRNVARGHSGKNRFRATFRRSAKSFARSTIRFFSSRPTFACLPPTFIRSRRTFARSRGTFLCSLATFYCLSSTFARFAATSRRWSAPFACLIATFARS
jgi:hypothetical protein